ncbi:MAG TPA: DNA mismatch repair protein MutS, partial [bacterium]|nr:DNA mismatch repair protein MutS [bacterium]
MPAQEKNTEIKLTPLMDQYHRIKREYPGALIFFRLGDFYEMFGEDAKKASRILNIALTSRQGYPMCGVPHHASENYLSKLIRAGLKVGIVEQMEDPSKAKGLVKRDLVRLV